MLSRHAAAPLSLLLAALAACEEPAPPPILERAPLARDTVRLVADNDTIDVSAEIARTASEKGFGLMDRDHLPPDEGMLFVYDADRAADDSFYMFRTRIPLDIAFADSAGQIVSILTMQPCSYPVAEFCPRYAPGVPYRVTLEVNSGYFERNGVEPGDLLVW